MKAKMKVQTARSSGTSSSTLLLFGVIIGLLAYAGVSSVSSIFAQNSGDQSLINACVKTGSGNVRIVKDSDKCDSNESRLVWTKASSSVPFGALITNQLSGYNNGKGTGSDNLGYRNFRQGNFKGSNLAGSQFDYSDFTNADLSDSNVSQGSFRSTNFSGANLTNANLRSGSFASTNFTDANLTQTNFTSSSVSEGSNFTHANFTNANLQQVNLSDAVLANAVWSNTICPDGTNSNSNGNTCEGHLSP